MCAMSGPYPCLIGTKCLNAAGVTKSDTDKDIGFAVKVAYFKCFFQQRLATAESPLSFVSLLLFGDSNLILFVGMGRHI